MSATGAPQAGDRLRPPGPGDRVQVVNLTRGSVLGTAVAVAATWRSRRRGLLGRQGLDPGEGLWLWPCRWVHSLGMAFALDVAHLDRQGVVVAAYRLAPGRVGPPIWRGASVLELPAGTLESTGTRRGDRLAWAPAGLPARPSPRRPAKGG
ncbi:DUF192 domain-containing protein [Thermaerobacter litoralis]